MIHPSTVIKSVSPLIGNGVYATEFIGRGTIMVVRDEYDLVLLPEELDRIHGLMRERMETHMYRDRQGCFILSWDHAKYMNHSCSSNTLMTAYDLEIAVRDIEPGEEITTDYGLLNIVQGYQIHCGCDGCRGYVYPDDIDRYADRWDHQIQESMLLINTVRQPLMSVFPATERERLNEYICGRSDYCSVASLKCVGV